MKQLTSSPKHVLMVDDDEAVLDMFTGILRLAGHEVTSFNRFEAAKAYLSVAKPDVLISDVRLGAFNGLQLVVFAKIQHPEMIAIVLTGFDDPVLRTEAAHAGASYLVKPVDTQRVLELVEMKPDTTHGTARDYARRISTPSSLH
jgi:two-component system, NtrC family, response regulator GlrR